MAAGGGRLARPDAGRDLATAARRNHPQVAPAGWTTTDRHHSERKNGDGDGSEGRRMAQAMSRAEAERFIRRRYGPGVGPLVPLGAGEWSRAYAFEVGGRELVARFGAHGEDFAKDARMARRR